MDFTKDCPCRAPRGVRRHPVFAKIRSNSQAANEKEQGFNRGVPNPRKRHMPSRQANRAIKIADNFQGPLRAALSPPKPPAAPQGVTRLRPRFTLSPRENRRRAASSGLVPLLDALQACTDVRRSTAVLSQSRSTAGRITGRRAQP